MRGFLHLRNSENLGPLKAWGHFLTCKKGVSAIPSVLLQELEKLVGLTCSQGRTYRHLMYTSEFPSLPLG